MPATPYPLRVGSVKGMGKDDKRGRGRERDQGKKSRRVKGGGRLLPVFMIIVPLPVIFLSLRFVIPLT